MENLEAIINIARIIAKEKTTGLTDEDNALLNKWLAEKDDNKLLYLKLKVNSRLSDEIIELGSFDAHKAYKNVKILITQGQKPRILSFIPYIYKYAASILILVGISYFAYFLFNKYYLNSQPADQIEPGTQKAILITSDQQRIELGKSKKRAIFRDRDAVLIDSSSTLVYQLSEKALNTDKENPVAFNQLETPRGGVYTLILPDGSKVMLNAQSRLRFPVIFSKIERIVELEGEAYFEIIHSEQVPFIVLTNQMKITVYGTSFNVSAYHDDEFIQTTLVKGIVGIKMTGKENFPEYKLKPGQQTSFDKITNRIETREVDTIIYTAWIKGQFVFKNDPLKQMLKKLSRWYDCEVEYKEQVLESERFTGEIKRYDNITKILDMISAASDIGFQIEGKKIIVYAEK
jgi:transmembrane sensor